MSGAKKTERNIMHERKGDSKSAPPQKKVKVGSKELETTQGGREETKIRG